MPPGKIADVHFSKTKKRFLCILRIKKGFSCIMQLHLSPRLMFLTKQYKLVRNFMQKSFFLHASTLQRSFKVCQSPSEKYVQFPDEKFRITRKTIEKLPAQVEFVYFSHFSYFILRSSTFNTFLPLARTANRCVFKQPQKYCEWIKRG